MGFSFTINEKTRTCLCRRDRRHLFVNWESVMCEWNQAQVGRRTLPRVEYATPTSTKHRRNHEQIKKSFTQSIRNQNISSIFWLSTNISCMDNATGHACVWDETFVVRWCIYVLRVQTFIFIVYVVWVVMRYFSIEFRHDHTFRVIAYVKNRTIECLKTYLKLEFKTVKCLCLWSDMDGIYITRVCSHMFN